MIKITFMGAGSTVFARNVLGDCMCTPALCEVRSPCMTLMRKDWKIPGLSSVLLIIMSIRTGRS